MSNNNIKIMHGDCFDVASSLQSNKYDLAVLDPPTTALNHGGRHQWDKKIDFSALADMLNRLITRVGQVCIFLPFKLIWEVISAFSEHFEFKHFFVWAKSNGMTVNKYHPMQDSEHILVFKRNGVKTSQLTFNPKATLQTEDQKPYSKKNYNRDISIRSEKKPEIDVNKTGARYVRTIQYGPTKPNMVKEERTSHPTQKPLSLVRNLIRVHSNEGDSIFDGFSGTGVVAISSLLELRNCTAVEQNREWYDESVTRLAKYQAQCNLFRTDAS